MSKRSTKIKAEELQSSSDTSSRQRQSKKDEALRKKLEQEFSKKSNNSSRTLTRRIPGTVSALRPNQAVTVKESMPVIESAQFMSAKRCDCVLVVNEEDQLSGIFTAKDIAYRVVAEGLDARTTIVSQIMTKNPLCVTSDTSATEALDLMVTRGFRHLPVCNEEGDIFGLLDITKCLYEALEKMERAFGSSRKLYDALEGVEREWAGESTGQMNEYMENLRESMSCPTLESVLDGTPPAQVRYKTNVKEIAVMMKELRTTAVLVTKSHKLQGIFTSKDIVLRVIAAGLNPENCTVARVMTPTPDTAAPETTVLDALKLMNNGHYLNLPVIGRGTIIGMVDVLKLTYVTLEQMNTIQGNSGEGGPMWSRFWDSFGAATDPMENESYLSENSHQHLAPPPHLSPQPSTSFKSYSDILPSESASMVNNNSNELASSLTTAVPITEDTFAFKFTLSEQKTHRVVSKPIYSELLEAVRLKLPPSEIESQTEWLTLSYLDDEQDQVLVTSDMDVIDAVQLAIKTGQSNVKLFVQDNRVKEQPKVVPEDVRQVKKVPSAENTGKEKASKPKNTNLLLPAAIGALGVVIIGAFVFSRAQKNSR
ncbi:hypothetical protein G6F57_003441 [Rhizopus arrhizus]|nr:hypothetical protein G6F23_001289 [Rhizopus arrhizus]KAG1426261.1 hypothetical protein G6F58_001571 [Rhizopus delemar]KAG0769219.1 hypothetical protein G6F24_001273 [Rhizopus arrhizus]KAG0797438.1 hypothetical protein G6F21_000536 [Rhizopus arrhizus]KAG0801278.1 hypothetical protein G6F22_001405 [Rhizopus arrhizus]